MANRDSGIKEGFGGMNFGKKSKLFHEMPDYKSKTSTKKPKLSKASNKFTDDFDKARQFLEDNFYHLKTELNSTDFNDVILALLEYKNKS